MEPGQSLLEPLRRSGQESPGGSLTQRILFAIMLAGLIVYALFFIYHACVVLLFPYSMDYGEPFLLNQARLLAEGESIYTPISTQPYRVGNYPPLYPVLLAGFVKVFGVHLWCGRLVSIVATLGVSLLIGLLIYHATEHRLAALVGALAFLSIYHVYEWGSLGRVDALALMFTVLGLWIVERSARLPFYLFFFVMAFFTRQTMLAGPASVFLYLWFLERRREAKFFALSFALSVTLIVAALNLWTSGEFFRHIVVYNANAYSLRDLFAYLLHLARFYAIFLAFGAIYFVYLLREGGRSLLFYFLVFSFFSGFMSGKVGAAPNYWLEFVVALCWALGCVYAAWSEMPDKAGRILREALPVFLIFQLAESFHIPQTRYDYSQTPDQRTRYEYDALEKTLEDFPSPIFSEDAGFPLLAGKEMVFQSFEFAQLAQQNLWDQAPLLEDLRTQKYSCLVLEFNLENSGSFKERFTPEFLQYAKARYRPWKQIGKFWIHVPIS